MFTVSKKTLIVYQILAHIAFVVMIIHGSFAEWLIAIGLYILFTTVGSKK